MQHTIQHIYKTHDNDGLLYAWFSSMHTRVDIILSCQKSEKELMSAVNHINPEKPDVPLNKNDAFQKVQKRRVQEKR